MTLSMLELATAREIVRSLLDQLRLRAYLFEVEPGAAHWQVRVDCAVNAQWQSALLEVEHHQLMAAEHAGAARETLLAAWRQQLRACARNPQDPG